MRFDDPVRKQHSYKFALAQTIVLRPAGWLLCLLANVCHSSGACCAAWLPVKLAVTRARQVRQPPDFHRLYCYVTVAATASGGCALWCWMLWLRGFGLCRRLVVGWFVFFFFVSSAVLSWLLAYQLQVYRFLLALSSLWIVVVVVGLLVAVRLFFPSNIESRFRWDFITAVLLTDSHWNIFLRLSFGFAPCVHFK